ncbi:hypothetical protein Trydic_g18988 [Trypoxylus dichotomus]
MVDLVISQDYGDQVTGSLLAETYFIYVYEEMELGARIASFEYGGSISSIGFSFVLPNNTANDFLGLEVRETQANLYHLVITKRQDYEAGINSYYLMMSTGTDPTGIRINIQNINDEPPIVQVNSASCPVEENNPDITDCSVTVRDADGHMTGFTIELLDGMDTVFELLYKDPVTNNDIKEITLLLKPKEELDYESIVLYVMDLEITDTEIVPTDGTHTTAAKVVVAVVDMPDTLPVWVSIFASQQFDELSKMNYTVDARDGDLGVNDDIFYETDGAWSEYITIGYTSGRIDVEPICRDCDAIQIYQFVVKACEVNMPLACTSQAIAFIVNDVNNQYPLITTNTTYMKLEENHYEDLPVTLSVRDLDIGDNALFDITLSSSGGQHSAFTVAPSTGYEEISLYLYVTNFTALDFEEEEWRMFDLMITTADRTTSPLSDSVTITVELINLNDEIPIFKDMDAEVGYTAAIPETAGFGTEIKTVLAEDRDINDSVTYSLLGTYINNILTIDNITGKITTNINRALDYETQEEVVLQVRAIDSLMEPFNTAIAQVIITVIDVNDETPRIIVGNQRVEIEENLADGTIIVNDTTNYLIATDDDQTANLNFEIDWDNSYATKTGQRVENVFLDYRECILIRSIDIPSSGNGKSVMGVLEIKETVKSNTPDYEKFEILYLNIVINDTNQEYGDGTSSVTVPIYIINIDDEYPEFVSSTITSRKNVVEESQDDTVIGVVLATDVDSDIINYRIEAEDSKYVGLVDINDLGEIYVTGKIDADIPIYSMSFTVFASDGEREVSASIIIYVIDINDNPPIFKYPVEGSYFNVSEQEENGYIIIEGLKAEDADRDAPNNEITYSLSSNPSFDNELRSFFAVNDGNFIVYCTDRKLDRDDAIPGIVNHIYITATDRGDNPASGEVTFFVTLIDINNKDPIINVIPLNERDESLNAGGIIGKITTNDRDEPGTINTRVNFEILDIIAVSGKEIPENMFDLENHDPDAGTIDVKTQIDLEGYHGTYELTIRTEDEGIEPGPCSSTATITVEINKYNFYDPLFNNPQEGNSLFLAKEQDIDSALYLYNTDPLPNFSATDQQGDKYELTFSIASDESELFSVRRITATTARLELRTLPDATEGPYTITLRVEPIEAFPLTATQVTVSVYFVDQNEAPVFTSNVQTIWFTENELNQNDTFYNAYFENLPDDLNFPVYYIITSDSPEFIIGNITENRISLTTELDREDKDSYEVIILSSRSETGVALPEERSVLVLTIRVRDENDNPPYFTQPTFFGSISTDTLLRSFIMQVTATDKDEDPQLKYSIEEYITIPTSVSSENPFIMDEDTGIISNDVIVLDTATGYFLFTIKVTDGNYLDSATVNIYIVSDEHRVKFYFINEVDFVDGLQNEIELILEEQFGYPCIIDHVTQNIDDNGNPAENLTVVRTHFIDLDLNQPINKSIIEETANTAPIFFNLSRQFEQHGLVLFSYVLSSTGDVDMEAVLKAWLIGVTIVLATLCIFLLVAFILKTRSLTKRLNKLSVIRYGSQESVSNRRAAPFTNKHAAEGSNPAYNEDKIRSSNGDAISVGSGDSDLFGVENNPEFDYKHGKQEDSIK